MLIGIAGGSGSGKTTLAAELARALGAERCAVLAQDHYYIDQSHRFDGDGGSVNFDHPSSIDFPLLASHLEILESGRGIDVPRYDFATHKRLALTERFEPVDFVIVEGTLILNDPLVRSRLGYKVFIQTAEALRFQRRLHRDTVERGRTPEGVWKQFSTQVKPMHDEFVEPSQQYADLVVSGQGALTEGLSRVLGGLQISV